MSFDPGLRKHIQIGMNVSINYNGKTIKGFVKKIITKENYNENGIEVQLKSGYIGLVKDKIENNTDELLLAEIEHLLIKDESQEFEFKSTIAFDETEYIKHGRTRVLDKLILRHCKVAASFMNTDGGILCIGVDDDKNTFGLDMDYEHWLGSQPNPRDHLQLKLTQEFQNRLINADGLYKMHIIKKDDKDICVIKIHRSQHPIFVKYPKISLLKEQAGVENLDFEHFFIRMNSKSISLPMSKFLNYWKNRNMDYT